MKHRTRIFALFLAFCLLVSLFPAAFAEEGNDTSALLSGSAESSGEAAYSGTCGENLTWTLDSEGLLTISGTGEMQNYINGEQPEWCSLNVLNAKIEPGVTSIGSNAFYNCKDLASITIPDGVTSIGDLAFNSCIALTSVSLPGTVTSIGTYAFSGCAGLATINIPDGVTAIENGSFDSCTSLTSITIPGTVTSIGDLAFSACSALTSITIPDSVTSIGESAFSKCSGLTSIKLPGGLTSIGFNAFSYCDSLKEITIPQSVTSINDSAFEGSGLTSITIPSSVERIGNGAFSLCKSLKEIVFKGNAPTFGEEVFGGMSATDWTMATAYYPANNGTWTDEILQLFTDYITWVKAGDDENGDDNGGENDEESIIASGSCGENVTWTLDSKGLLTISGTGEMQNYYYEEAANRPYINDIHEVIIEPGATSIGSFAFAFCPNLTSITIPDSVTSIKSCAFDYCSSLTNITIPDSVTSIGRDAFYKCTALTDISIPNSVTSIDNRTFSGCTSLSNVNISNSVTSIGDSAFSECASLTSITIPDSVTSISSSAFSVCTGLTEIIAAPGSENYSSVDGILFNKDKTVLIFYPAGKLETEYTIPDGVKSIGANAFTACTNLTSISIPDSVTSIGLFAFSGCTALTSINIPDSVTNIDDGAFWGCSALTSVKLSGSLKNIGECLFQSCNNLKEVTIPNSVTIIYNSAFSGSGLTSINIPGSVADIYGQAFQGCESLNTIVFEGNAPEIFYQAFGNVTATAYYPANNDTWTEEVRQSYGGSITWVEASNKVELDSSEIAEGSSIWVDGIEYNYSDLVGADGKLSLELAGADAKAITTYTYKTGDSAHTSYPTGMEVWLLSHDGTEYTAEHVTELDNLLGYSGCSIRVSGEKGIRMITSIDQTLRCTLKDSGVRGYKVVEYGTLLAWASEVPASQLVLGANGVKSNYAYLRDVADPVFAYKGNAIQYTNVITGFTLDQCSPDLVMRPYIKLCDSDGNEAVIYGGVVQRSIGYIAYQNRSSFAPGTNAYEYVWSIIHHVYGDAYDA